MADLLQLDRFGQILASNPFDRRENPTESNYEIGAGQKMFLHV